MKCEDCHKRIKVISGNTDVAIENVLIRVINIPIWVCPVCGKQVIHDVIIARAKNYFRQYGAQNNIMDFADCEQKDNDDATVVMQTLGVL